MKRVKFHKKHNCNELNNHTRHLHFDDGTLIYRIVLSVFFTKQNQEP